MRNKKAFTLIEIMIVVVLLGFLAAVVIPAIANSAMSARESALACDVKMLRRYVLIYKGQHLEVAPGYPNGDTTQAPTAQVFLDQMMLSSNLNGQTAPVGTPGFPRGPYLMRMPENPLNNKGTIEMLGNGVDFPANADDSYGWIYKAETAEIRPDNTGISNNGLKYYDY